MRLEAWAGSDVGLVRAANEDSVGCFADLGLFVVCDGLGGHASGEVASRLAVEAMREFFLDKHAAAGRKWRLFGAARAGEELIEAAVRHADSAVRTAAKELPAEERTMATTVVALRVEPGQARATWAHVGDSRLYHLRAGKLELLTADHTVPGSRYQSGDPVPADLPHSNRLLQALGTGSELEIAARSRTLQAGDVLLLCSDGLSGLVSADVIAETLAADGSPQHIGERLIRLALDAGGKDNTSVVIVRSLGD